MSAWSFHNPVRIEFGAGRLQDLPELAHGDRVLLVTTPGFTRRGVTARVRDALGAKCVRVLDEVEPNPDVRALDRLTAKVAGDDVTGLVALGGGSVMDTAKALSVTIPAAREGFTLEAHFLEGAPLPATDVLPLVAVPTTAGTGSEVTPFATVWDHAAREKHSLASPRLFPRVALLDPELTLDLPWHVTVSTGLDALSQGFEAVWNRNATPVTTALATRAIAEAFDALPRVADAPQDIAARSRMLEASLLAGLAISRTRTALAHSMSYPVTAEFGLPHGLACSFTLPALLRFNAAADDGRLHALARALGESDAKALAWRLEAFLVRVGAPALVQEHAPSLNAIVELAPRMLTPGRSDNNLRECTVRDVVSVLRATPSSILE